jgi:hypothetical protein
MQKDISVAYSIEGVEEERQKQKEYSILEESPGSVRRGLVYSPPLSSSGKKIQILNDTDDSIPVCSVYQSGSGSGLNLNQDPELFILQEVKNVKIVERESDSEDFSEEPNGQENCDIDYINEYKDLGPKVVGIKVESFSSQEAPDEPWSTLGSQQTHIEQRMEPPLPTPMIKKGFQPFVLKDEYFDSEILTPSKGSSHSNSQSAVLNQLFNK